MLDTHRLLLVPFKIAVANDLKDIAGDEDVWIVVTYQATVENRDWLNDEKKRIDRIQLLRGKRISETNDPFNIVKSI